MRVEEFLSLMDALRFDSDLDEKYPELRGMVRKVYPYIRQIYNMMNEMGMLNESINESLSKWYVVDDGEVYNVLPEEDVEKYEVEPDQIIKVTTNMDIAFKLADKLNREAEESSPNFSPMKGYYDLDEAKLKRHNGPKNLEKANRKGNRDAERDIYGDGFKSKNKIHKANNGYNRKDNKVDIRSLSESQLKKIISESILKVLGKIN